MGTPKKINEYPFLLEQESLHNLTLDELMINNNNAEERQMVIHNINPASSSSSSSSPPLFMNGNLGIDEIWNDKNTLLPPTTEELTLDEFLIRAGAIKSQEGFVNQNQMPLMQRSIDEISQRYHHVMDHDHHQLNMICQVPKSLDIENHEGRSIVFGGDENMRTETIERRQRRMIKNRESAARSRARKQAYTNQLKHDVVQLQTANNWLKKRKEVEMLLNSNSTSGPIYQLRRTSSTTF